MTERAKTPFEEMADRVYAKTDQRRWHIGLDPAVNHCKTDQLVRFGWSDDERRSHNEGISAKLLEAGLDVSTLGQRLYLADHDARLATVVGQQVDPAELRAKAEDFRGELIARFHGDVARADRAQARLEDFVSKHGWLKETLSQGTLGADAQVLMPLVEHLERVGG